jgi:bifunctional NMN adenylyltransferase/nudix hydrolase
MRADYAVYIGRFQPFHLGHFHVLTQALSLASHVIVILGSSFGPRTVKNPFTHEERETMIRACLTDFENKHVTFVPIEDSVYNDGAWEAAVVAAVDDIILSADSEHLPTVIHVGHDKDAGASHVRMFPQWKFVEAGQHTQKGKPISATDFRNAYFSSKWNSAGLWDYLPVGVQKFLSTDVEADGSFYWTPAREQLEAEKAFIDKYRASWASAPYPPTFVTVDAVVVQSSHILLVERRAEPGRGLWALPGGFLDQGERILDATIRELREETRLKVPEAVLRGNVVTTKVFDDPGRSLRGRTITHASLIHLPPHGDGLPAVKASSDASKAQWWHINHVKRSMMFEDHQDILMCMWRSL